MVKATTGLNYEILKGLLGRELDNVEEQALDRLKTSVGQRPLEFYHTVGVYNNDDKKENHVAAGDLAAHLVYNLQARPGRAFFVNGICFNYGYLGFERAAKYERRFAKEGMPRMRKASIPYQ